MTDPPLSLRPGECVAQHGDDFLRIPTTTGPDGAPMLVVLCDVPGMMAAQPEQACFELEGRALLEIARAHGAGVIVQNELDGKRSWPVSPERT